MLANVANVQKSEICNYTYPRKLDILENTKIRVLLYSYK